MKWYYLATLIWVVKILMFALVITIPAVLYLIHFNNWFCMPFVMATATINQKKEKNNESNNDER